MDVRAMLDKCRREQWALADLDWSVPPRPMSPGDEVAVVQYFTDMAGIERLAGALFEEQARRATEPALAEIFRSFVRDEARHAAAAERLARHYDVHHYRSYEMHPALVKFTPHFVDAVRYLSAEIANVYIASGEVLLDVALLRSLDEYVDDEMCRRAMHLINRDESRHLAVDFHMAEYYGSAAYVEVLATSPARPLRDRVRAAWAMANVLYLAAPLFRAVFFDTMEVVDPSSKRLREAFKRIQLLGAKPTLRRSKFVKLLEVLHEAYNGSPVVRLVFGRAISRFLGVPERVIERLYSDAERRRAASMSFDELAAETLAAKYTA